MSLIFLAYLIIVLFFALDIVLRKPKKGTGLSHAKDDNHSTKFIVLTFLIILVLAELLTLCNIGFFHYPIVAYFALLMMITGIVVRIHAMRTLREFYTRTLLTTDKQKLIETGPYKIVRHPGYLGTVLVWIFFGPALQNYIITAIGMMLILATYVYRIKNEERMLLKDFGKAYETYRAKTWRLIPFLW